MAEASVVTLTLGFVRVTTNPIGKESLGGSRLVRSPAVESTRVKVKESGRVGVGFCFGGQRPGPTFTPPDHNIINTSGFSAACIVQTSLGLIHRMTFNKHFCKL